MQTVRKDRRVESILDEAVKDLRHGGDAFLDGGSSHAGECRECLSSTLILGAVRNLASDYRRPQCSFGPVIRRLHFRIVEEVQHPLPIVLQPDSIQQSLVVRISEAARP